MGECTAAGRGQTLACTGLYASTSLSNFMDEEDEEGSRPHRLGAAHAWAQLSQQIEGSTELRSRLAAAVQAAGTDQVRSYSLDQWGWAQGIQELQHEARELVGSHTAGPSVPDEVPSHQHSNSQHDGTSRDGRSGSVRKRRSHGGLAQLLANSRPASAAHCAAELVQQLGLSDACQSLSMSALHALPRVEQLDSLREAAKQHINASWAHEAIKQGVAHAKQGQYSEARRCYDKALELQPDNVDAFVARGAALANESKYPAAAADLKQALELDPGNANASRYLEAVKARAEKEGVSLEPAPQPPPPALQPDVPGPTTKAAPAALAQAVHEDGAQREGKRRRSSEAQDSDSSSADSSGHSSGSSGSGHAGNVSSIKAALQAVLKARKSKKHKSGSKRKSRDKKSGKRKKRKK